MNVLPLRPTQPATARQDALFDEMQAASDPGTAAKSILLTAEALGVLGMPVPDECVEGILDNPTLTPSLLGQMIHRAFDYLDSIIPGVVRRGQRIIRAASDRGHVPPQNLQDRLIPLRPINPLARNVTRDRIRWETVTGVTFRRSPKTWDALLAQCDGRGASHRKAVLAKLPDFPHEAARSFEWRHRQADLAQATRRKVLPPSPIDALLELIADRHAQRLTWGLTLIRLTPSSVVRAISSGLEDKRVHRILPLIRRDRSWTRGTLLEAAGIAEQYLSRSLRPPAVDHWTAVTSLLRREVAAHQFDYRTGTLAEGFIQRASLAHKAGQPLVLPTPYTVAILVRNTFDQGEMDQLHWWLRSLGASSRYYRQASVAARRRTAHTSYPKRWRRIATVLLQWAAAAKSDK